MVSTPTGNERAAKAPHDFPRSGTGVAVIVQLGLERGLAVVDLLADTSLRADHLDDPGFTVTPTQELTVLRNLRRLLPDRAGLGLDLGRRYRLTTFGPLGYGCLTSATLGEAMLFALPYVDLTFGFCIPEVGFDGDQVTFSVRDDSLPPDLRDLLLERDITALLTFVGDLIPGGVLLTSLRLAIPRPDDSERYIRIWGIEPEFGASETSGRLPMAILGTPLPQADAVMHERCANQCRTIAALRRGETHNFIEQVRERLSTFDDGVPTIDELADEYHMSTRTLRRRLSTAGTSYRTLLSEVRKKTAVQLLSEGMQVGTVAHRLGYTDAASFIRAYTTWTGTTPHRSRDSPAHVPL
ncbi:AraC family transcriptional regulator [Tsukamurella soli]|uniref:AraC family transcriptional regulator n=1 Tax=Tsukamurella soli TaxID=644556 RepID=A0ABP8K7Q9_9ACTN